MKVTVLLADSAQSDASGKVHALGLGWTRTPAPTAPMAIIVQIEFNGDEGEVGHHDLEITLRDDEGTIVSVDGKSGKFGASLNYTPDDTSGPELASLVVSFAPGMPLNPDRRYEWRVAVDGKSEPHWAAGFRTMPPAAKDEDTGNTQV